MVPNCLGKLDVGNMETLRKVGEYCKPLETSLSVVTFGLTMEYIPRKLFYKLHDESRNNFTTLKMNLLTIFSHQREKWSAIDQFISLK